LGALALVSTVAALVVTFRSPDRMLLIALLYAAAFAAAITGERFRRWRGMRSNGLKMLVMLAVLGCLTSVSVWTVLDTWSTIGKCERHEKMQGLSDTRLIWYEGTACTEEQREGYWQDV
jgi:hypothetical protein